METFGEKISAGACSGKEIAGLLRKMMMKNNDSRVANWRQVGMGWAYVQLEMSPKNVAVCFQGLARLSRRVRRRVCTRIT